MKTVLILAGLVALVSAKTVPLDQIHTKRVDPEFVDRLKKVLSLFKNIENVDTEADYYKVGHDYDVEANIENYSNKEAVEDFLKLYRSGFLPKYYEFSIFYERMRDEAIALFNLFYYAKDFETFYKTAAYARVHHNQGQFLYAYYIAILQRKDTHGFVLPAPYEVYPHLFTNWDTQTKIIKTKMMDGLTNPTLAAEYGIFVENDDFVFYSNYSNSLSYPDEEQRLTYLTEDIGWNSYYYFFHSHLPFWWNSDKFGSFKERRGEIYYYFYQQLMARYYLERLTNGLDNTPQFSWFSPIRTGYYPALTSKATPFAQRSEYFDMHTVNNYEEVRFLDAYEKSFIQFLQRGHFKAYDQEIDFHNPKAVNFVGNYWQANADLYELNVTQDYQRSYEIIARRVLGAAPKPFDEYCFVPSSLDFYQTSLRDPAFYQLYNRILDYIVQFKEYLKPHPAEKLHFAGVKVNDVKVDKLVTFFEHYDFDANNMLSYGKDQLTSYPHTFKVRQARLNQKPFTVTVDIKSDVETDAVIKFFLGPKYDNEGYPFNIEENWMNFFELDWFTQKLTPGQNSIVRKSENFTIFKEDSLSMAEIYKLLDNGLIPHDQSVEFSSLPRRLMLPKGTHGGYPFQFFVFVYPFKPVDKDIEPFEPFVLDNKPLGYPLDRPVNDPYFKQPNMFFKDVLIYHEGHPWAYKYNVPSELVPSNMVPKS